MARTSPTRSDGPLEDYDFTFPKRIPKQKILRFFDCQFFEQNLCGVFIGPTGTGKTHLLTALGYTACEKGISVRFTRVVDMINVLTTAQINGTLEKALKAYINPSVLLLDSRARPTRMRNDTEMNSTVAS